MSAAAVRHFRRAWSCKVCGFVYLRRRDCREHWQTRHALSEKVLLKSLP